MSNGQDRHVVVVVAAAGSRTLSESQLAKFHVRVRTAASTVCAMLEYELYLPLHYNDGSRIEPDKLQDLKKRLVAEFGGLTHFQQQNEGLWKIGEHTFRDRIEIVRVLASDEVSAQQYFAQLKSDLRRDWNQQDFLIVSREVTAV